MDALSILEKWYSAQSNGDWEHQYAVHIDTLDNPGWVLEIDLAGTDAEDCFLKRVVIQRSETDWFNYWVDNKKITPRQGLRT